MGYHSTTPDVAMKITKSVEDGDPTNSVLSDGPQRPTGSGDTVEAAKNIGDFERLQDEIRLKSWEGEEDVYEGAGRGVQGVRGRAAAHQWGLTLFPPFGPCQG